MTAYIRDLNHGADADVQTRVNTHWDQDGIVTRNRDADYLGFLWGHDDRDISTRIKPTRFQRRVIAVGRAELGWSGPIIFTNGQGYLV